MSFYMIDTHSIGHTKCVQELSKQREITLILHNLMLCNKPTSTCIYKLYVNLLSSKPKPPPPPLPSPWVTYNYFERVIIYSNI